ncbi:MAG: MFS transporter [Ignavibacteriae bacterium]|nr:MFS transporter [Ignavibacteriota bacterium]
MDLWRKNLYVLWATQFIAMVGMNLVVPFLPFFIRTLGVTDEAEVTRWSGLVFAGPFVSSFFATPFWGNMGDKYGRKPMVIRALIGLAASQILIGFSQTVFQVFVFRILQGAISGFIASALALVSTSAPKNRVGYALGVLQSASAGGVVLGPFFGGVLADLVGFREIFFITAVMCMVGALAVIYGVEEVRDTSADRMKFSVFDNYKLMYANKQLRLVALCLVVGQVSVLMVEPIFALFVESFKTDTAYIATLAGSIFSVTGLFSTVSAPWWGKRNDRKGYKKGLFIGMTLTGVAYIGHNLVTGLLQLAVLRALLGFARGGVLPALYSLANLHAPPERRGGIIAIASSMTILGNMLGPVLGGIVASHTGIREMFLVNSALALVVAFVIWKMMEDAQTLSAPKGITQETARTE